MPRKSKAELDAEREEFRKQQEEELRNGYLPYLLKQLGRASKCGFSIKVEEETFVVSYSNYSGNAEVKLPAYFSKNAWGSLYDLEWDLDMEEKKREEELRRINIRTSALAKLTPEERAALGI